MPESSLAKKMKLKSGQRAAIVNAPSGYLKALSPCPPAGKGRSSYQMTETRRACAMARSLVKMDTSSPKNSRQWSAVATMMLS